MRRMRGRWGFMATTVDLEKAHDNLPRDVIEDTLKAASIPSRLRMILMDCMTTPTAGYFGMESPYDPHDQLRCKSFQN